MPLLGVYPLFGALDPRDTEVHLMTEAESKALIFMGAWGVEYSRLT